MDDAIDLDLQAGCVVAVLAGNPEGGLFARHLLQATPLRFRLVVLGDQPLHLADERCVQWPIDSSSLHRLAEMLADTATPRLGVVCGWPGRLPAWWIELFGGRLLNAHAGDLPRYRGAGGGSWQVLNDERTISADVQRMAAAIDAGPILLRERIELPVRPYPADVKQAAASGLRAVLQRLVERLVTGGRWPLQHQDHAFATSFPRLSTAENGWIDFSWTAAEIERFIRAFSDPYAGATFRHGNSVFRVRRGELRADRSRFHPFCTGLIANTSPNAIEVIARDGIVVMSDLRTLDGEPAADSLFRVGGRCYSTAEDLLSARVHRPRSGLPAARDRDDHGPCAPPAGP